MLGLVEPFVHLEWRRVRELVEPLQRAKDTIGELRAQNENLKEQVRVEVERRAKLEEELEDSERVRSENLTLKEELARLRCSAEDSRRLVQSSRRLQRQQADQMLALKVENSTLRKASEEAGPLEAEVASLRALVCDKNEVMLRQSRTMESLKELIQRLRRVHPSVSECIEEFFHQPDVSEDDEDEAWRSSGSQALRRLSARPKSGAVRVPSRSSVGQMRSVSVTSNRSGVTSANSANAATKAASRPKAPLSKKRLDAICSLYVQLGSRVTVEVQGNPEPGIVKFVGPVQSGDPDIIFVGVRLQSALGSTDGEYKGVRYFTTPQNCGVLVRAHKILSVFNPKKNSHTSLNDCVQAYLKLQH